MNRRHFYFWCTSCRTILHVETAEGADIPDEPPCAMCEAPTRDYDVLAAHGETPLNDSSWEAFEAWRSPE